MQVRLQRYIVFLAIALFIGKLVAWYLTDSVAILTDALESTVNVVASIIGLYSLILASRPRDINHPYGHGKAEYISSAVEGALIFVAGLIIIYEAVMRLFEPHEIHSLDVGTVIIGATGVINFFAGAYAIRQSKQNGSLVIEAAGKHLRSDAYSTFALVIGLILVALTDWLWLDSVVALIFAVVIIVTGYRVVRKSLMGIMDETDMSLLKEVIDVMQQHRKPQWVDLHNLRVITVGDAMHIDAHLTLPWYYQVQDAEREVHDIEAIVRSSVKDQIEFFIHVDACKPYQCKLCALAECPVRQEELHKQLEWNIDNVWTNEKHGKEK